MTHGWAFLLLAVLHGLASLFNGEATGKGAGQLAGLHLYDTGHLLAAGGVTAGALWLWRRLVRGRYETLAGFAALALVCAAVGLVVLGDDVTLRAGRMPHWFKPHVWKILLSVGIAEGVCAAAIFAQRVRAGWALGLGAALGLGHAFVLPQLYPGVHLIAAWTAAVMMGVGLQEWAGPPFDRLPPTGRVIAVVGALAAAVVSLVVPPSPNVRSALGQSTVTVLAPYALRLHPMEMGDEPAVLTDAERPWYSPRPDGVRAPSTPPFALPDRHASGPTPPWCSSSPSTVSASM